MAGSEDQQEAEGYCNYKLSTKASARSKTSNMSDTSDIPK